MVLSLQAIDFLLASSIQDGWLLSEMDCRGDDGIGEEDGEEEDGEFFLIHLSPASLPGTLVGLDSERKQHVSCCST